MNRLKFLSVLFIAIGVSFSSCKKDKDDEIELSALKGKWQQTKDVTTYYLGTTEQEKEVDTDFDSDDYITISDSRIIYGNGYYAVNYKVEGDYILTTEIGSTETDKVKIKKLTSTELVVESEDVDQEGGVTTREVTESTYKKVN